MRNWTVGEEKAGLTVSAGGFTFATVDAAGHMVRAVYLVDYKWGDLLRTLSV